MPPSFEPFLRHLNSQQEKEEEEERISLTCEWNFHSDSPHTLQKREQDIYFTFLWARAACEMSYEFLPLQTFYNARVSPSPPTIKIDVVSPSPMPEYGNVWQVSQTSSSSKKWRGMNFLYFLYFCEFPTFCHFKAFLQSHRHLNT